MCRQPEQEKIEVKNFILSSGIQLSQDNRWVVLAKLIPWEKLEEENTELFSRKKGALVKPFRMALGALIIKKKMETTDRETVALIQENPYLQYFIGLSKYNSIAPFEPSMMVDFKQKINKKIIDKINRIMIEDKANPCVHEMVLIQPLTRQVLFERHDYTRPNSGIINPDSQFKASEFVHVGLIVDCDHEKLDFYDQVLGLRRTVNNSESKYGEASSRILELKKPENGERMLNYYFTAPLTSTTDKPTIRSGNLEVLRFEGSLPNKLSYSRPGCLGVCLYTMKVRDIKSYHQRVSNSEATKVRQVRENAFTEKSFSFVAPDGYFWTLLE